MAVTVVSDLVFEGLLLSHAPTRAGVAPKVAIVVLNFEDPRDISGGGSKSNAVHDERNQREHLRLGETNIVRFCRPKDVLKP